MKRNCSTGEDFDKESCELRDILLQRSYYNKQLKKAFNQAKSQFCEMLLFSNRVESSNTTTRSHQQVRNILQMHRWLLQMDTKLTPFIKAYLEITFKRALLYRTIWFKVITHLTEINFVVICQVSIQ